jgi:anti-sigma B factor antagonist
MNVVGGTKEGVLHLRLHGSDSLDCANAAHVRNAALAKVNGTQDIVVDLSGIEFVDSAGIGVLVSVFKAARASGKTVKFVVSRPGVVSVLELIKLDQIFDIHPDFGSAVKAIRAELAQV